MPEPALPQPQPPADSASPDYDGHWKDALDCYFGPCLALLGPELHAEIDWTHPPEFLDKELQKLAGARRRGRRHVDKLALLRLVGGGQVLLLLHVEIQGRAYLGFAERMYTYHYRLRERYPGHELVQLVIFTRAGKLEDVLRYRYAPLGGRHGTLDYTLPVVQLAQWAARRAELRELARENPFALIVLAELEAAARHTPNERLVRKTELVRLLYAHGYGEADVRRLFIFIDGVLALPPDLELEFSSILEELEGETDMAYITSVERVGIRKGWAQGMRHMLTAQLERRFGPLPDDVRQRIDQADPDDLQRWSLRVLDAASLDEVWG